MNLKENETDVNNESVVTEESKRINAYLASLTKTPLGKPKYRLVWSEDMFELRGRQRGDSPRWMKKYSYMKDRWLLECWYPPEVYVNEELPTTMLGKGYYEVFYVFENKNKPLELRLDVVEMLMTALLNRNPKTVAQRVRDIEARMAAEEKRLDDYTMDLLNEDGDLVGALHDGDAVSLAGVSFVQAADNSGDENANN